MPPRPHSGGPRRQSAPDVRIPLPDRTRNSPTQQNYSSVTQQRTTHLSLTSHPSSPESDYHRSSVRPQAHVSVSEYSRDTSFRPSSAIGKFNIPANDPCDSSRRKLQGPRLSGDYCAASFLVTKLFSLDQPDSIPFATQRKPCPLKDILEGSIPGLLKTIDREWISLCMRSCAIPLMRIFMNSFSHGVKFASSYR